jgi:hypothetical protein
MVKNTQVPTLPKLDIRRIGDFLFCEALIYDQLEVVPVGTHVSYLIHFDPKGKKRPWVEFHYRRGLKQLSNIVDSDGIDSRRKIREISKTFLRTLEIDLHLFAKELKENPLLRDIRMLVGLSGLSALWGRRHGFTTALYTDDEKLIRRHDDSITDNPNKGKNRLTPLHLFFITPRRFIREFYNEKLSCI